MCLKRLRSDLRSFQQNPPAGLRAAPKEENILEWHYVIEGSEGSAYEGGYYHGVVQFPKDFPMRPPSLLMITPNGRFKTNTRLCLSMSDFHPESWNPLWSTSTILLGLASFMLEEAVTYGSITSSTALKKQYADQSLAFNVKDTTFCALFPELVQVHKVNLEASRKANSTNNTSGKQSQSSPQSKLHDSSISGAFVVALIAFVLGSVFFLVKVSLN